MNCPAPHRLSELGKLGADKRAEIEKHVTSCAACRSASARIESARLGLSEMRASEPPEISGLRIEAALRWSRPAESEPANTSWWRSGRTFGIGLGFAGAAAGLLIAWKVTSHRQSASPTQVLAKAPSAAPKVAKAESLKAIITQLAGKVTLHRGGESKSVNMRTVLASGDRLTSAARARVAAEWGTDSGMLLYSDADLSLDRFDAHGQKMVLERGKLAVRSGPHTVDEFLEVKTPAHLVRVHGSWFTVAAEGSRTSVEVLEGTVEVMELNGGASTMLRAPVRATFGRGRTTSSSLSAKEASVIRTQAELNLLPWSGLDLAIKDSGTFVIDGGDANVAIDGLSVGSSPIAVRRPQGKHFVELTRPGFAPVQKWISIGPEEGELRTSLVHEERPEGDIEAATAELEKLAAERSRFVRGCYERSLKRDSSLAGTVTLKLAIGSVGQVQRVSVEESTLDDPDVAECLKHEAQGWSFHAGKNATLMYPFVFRPR